LHIQICGVAKIEIFPLLKKKIFFSAEKNSGRAKTGTPINQEESELSVF